MLNKIDVRVIISVVSLGILSACGETPSETKNRHQAVIDSYNLSEIEAKAFKTCQSQMRKADFTPRSSVRMSRVPAEICACHAPMMVKHFRPGSGSEHALVLAYVAGASKDTSLNPNSLINPNQPGKQFMALANHLNNCAETSAQENNNATKKKIEELCAQGKLDAKKCEKIQADLK